MQAYFDNQKNFESKQKLEILLPTAPMKPLKKTPLPSESFL